MVFKVFSETVLGILLLLAGFGSSTASEFVNSIPRSCSRLPPHLKLVNETYVLPDPFHFLNGEPVKSRQDWLCRSAQLRGEFTELENFVWTSRSRQDENDQLIEQRAIPNL